MTESKDRFALYVKVMKPISTIRPVIKKSNDIRPAGLTPLVAGIWRKEVQHNDPPHLADCASLLRRLRDHENFSGTRRPDNEGHRVSWTKNNDAIREQYFEGAMRVFFISMWH